MKLFRCLVGGWLLAFGLIRADAAHTEARLLLSHSSAKPGQSITAALQLKMAPRWHTYWTYSGDSGAPTKIEWELPQGITAGEIRWPVPEKLTVSGLTTYIYENEVVLLVPLQIAKDAKAGPVELKAKVSWLECEEVCIPERAEVQTRLIIGDEDSVSESQTFISQWETKVPELQAPFTIIGSWSSSPSVEARLLSIELGKPATTADFFPYASDEFEIVGETERSDTAIIKKVKKSAANWPSLIKGVLVLGAAAERKGYEVTLNLGADTADPGATLGVTKTPPISTDSPPALLAMLGLAFLGGLILNVMPCVLPVIALKILGFVSEAHQEPRRVRQLGLIYASGVLVSFLVLASFVIGVKSARGLASWGMQFQSPVFLVLMLTLVTLVALNLFGVFEVSLGGGTMGAAGNLALRGGTAGAFFNGVLATVLATPCSAPFLGTALGFAFTQPGPTIMLIFLAIGLGLAAPYVVLCWQPEWLKFLPKPGVWMEKFKMAMGFPMLATVVWLFWVALEHFSSDGPLWLGLFLVAVAFSAWVWGEFVQRGTKRRGFAMAIAAVILIVGYVAVLEGQLHWRATGIRATAGVLENNGGIAWERWSPEAVAKARTEGKPVLVDFTARWCPQCQVNKRTSIEIDSVRAKLKEIGAVALIGDYGKKDPAITQELIRHRRAAVPLVLVYPSDPSAEPIILPSVLTPSFVLNALTQAVTAKKTVFVK